MVLTCGDRESPSEMMRLTAVVGNCVLLSAVVTGGLPQLCPSEISERTGRARLGHPAQLAGRSGIGSGGNGEALGREGSQGFQDPVKSAISTPSGSPPNSGRVAWSAAQRR